MSNSDYSDDFINVIRAAANDTKQSVSDYLNNLFDGCTRVSKGKKIVDFDGFSMAVSGVRGMKKKVTKSNMREIFEECADEDNIVTVEYISRFCDRNLSRARMLSLKLRLAIVQKYKGEVEYRRVFNTIKSFTSSGKKYLEIDSFREFAEDTLEVVVKEGDGVMLYNLYDCDEDGKVSLEDFLKFISNQSSSTDAASVLCSGNSEVIVDIRISGSRSMDAELQQQGYTCLFPEFSGGVNAIDKAAFGSFGRGQSMWVWKQSQGTCSGRLKPIIDIQLDGNYISSALVLSGYTCLAGAVSGQYVWIKRAQSMEEEKDAIVELHVSTGRMKNPSDAIWQGPGGGGSSAGGMGRDGWIRIDGNFGKGIMSSTDAFLWFRPKRPKSLDAYMASPISKVATISDETRYSLLLSTVQIAVRNYIPLAEVNKLANVSAVASVDSTAATSQKPMLVFNYLSLFHLYDNTYRGGSLSFGSFERLLNDVGLHMERADMQRCFYFFNIKQDRYITHEEFAGVLNLTEYHIDSVTELIRAKLLHSFHNADGKKLGKARSMRYKIDEDSNAQIGKTSTQIKENRLLSNIFNSVNLNKDGILSREEVQELCIKLHIYVTEVEASKILQRMDINGDDRVDESDFINFIQKEHDVTLRKAARVRDAASHIRNYFKRRAAHDMNTTRKHLQKEWNDLKKRHETAHRKFPGYLNVEDVMLLLASMGLFLSPVEAYDVVLAIALDKNGKIYPNDLDAFANRSCRSVGELTALLERDVMAPILTIYRNFRDSVRADDEMVKQRGVDYQSALKDIFKSIQDAHAKEVLVHKTTGTNTPPTSPNPVDNKNSTNIGTAASAPLGSNSGAVSSTTRNCDVVSVSALKRGFEDALKGYQTPDHLMPNLEEYVCLATVVGAEVAADSYYGIRVKDFVEGLCVFVAGDIGGALINGYSLDILCRDLRKMILEESVNAAYTSDDSKTKGDLHMSRKNPDFIATFNLFDQDHNGNLSINEFKDLLLRLQLVDSLPQEQLPALLGMFDKGKKGHITCDDFIAFVRSGGSELLEYDDGDSVHSNYEEDLLQCQSAPVAITQNADCDFLTWQLWRQCLLLDSQDPESVITDIETACCDVEIAVRAMEEDEGPVRETRTHGTNSLFPSNPHAPSGYIAKDELWQILKDITMSVAGDTSNVVISHSIFEKGIVPLMEDFNSKISGSNVEPSNRVDYESLCKHVIRMGRAFNAQVQARNAEKEKKYIKMKEDLFQDMMSHVDGDSVSKLSKYEKVFRRLDHNGDGKISYQEFKDGLKRIRFKDQKYWTVSLIRRLFNDLDADSDGDLSIAELTSALRRGTGTGEKDKIKKSRSKIGDKWYDSDEESGQFRADDDFLLFSQRKKTFSEYELYRKVFDILLDTIPANALEETNPHLFKDMSGASRRDVTLTSKVDTVVSVIRKLFRRSDPDGQGYVSEERFLSFCRRSELSARLSTVELRRLVDRLRTGDTDDFGRTGGSMKMSMSSAKKKVGSRAAVNYELFCQMLSSVSENKSHARADQVVIALREAADESAAAGRPFTMLCELVDIKHAEKITIQEFQHICKMMACEMSVEDVHIIRELLQTVNGRPSKGNDGSIYIDYYAVDDLLETYGTSSAREADSSHINPSATPALLRSGSLPSYATPMVPLSVRGDESTVAARHDRRDRLDRSTREHRLHNSASQGTLRGSATSPVRRSAPLHSHNRSHSLRHSHLSRSRGIASAATSVEREDFHTTMALKLCETAALAISNRTLSRGRHYNLEHQFEDLDRQKTGYISMSNFQCILDEELGISLRAADIAAIRAVFGANSASTAGKLDIVDYQHFCTVCAQVAPDSVETTTRGAGGRGARPPRVPSASSEVISGSASYITEKVIRKYFELQDNGIDVLAVFQEVDEEDIGLLDIPNFCAVLKTLQLVQYEFQLNKIVDEFACVNEPALVEYKEFCALLEAEANAFLNDPSPRTHSGSPSKHHTHSRRRIPIVGSSGSDEVLEKRSVEGWLTHKATPKQQRQFSEVYDSIHQYQSLDRGHPSPQSRHDILSDLDDEDDHTNNYLTNGVTTPVKRSLNLPKPSSSFALNSSRDGWGAGTSNNYSLKKERDFQSNAVGRSSSSGNGMVANIQHSPSKVGAAIWGIETPLHQKGVLDSDDNPIHTHHHRYDAMSDTSGSYDGASAQVLTNFDDLTGRTNKSSSNSRWTCPVCYYTENQPGASECEVCSSPNHTCNKEFQLKAQCNNCTFLNGSFARNCEMCGAALK